MHEVRWIGKEGRTHGDWEESVCIVERQNISPYRKKSKSFD